jgi:hypothetical protein
MKQIKEIYRRIQEIDRDTNGAEQREQTEATLDALYQDGFVDGQEAARKEMDESNLVKYVVVLPDELNNYQSYTFLGTVGDKVILSKRKI